MKNHNNYLDSNTSSIVPSSYYSTSNYPFLPIQIYIVNLVNPFVVVEDNFIEFTNESLGKALVKESHPKAGFLKGTFITKDNFDEPIEEFSDYM